MPRLTGIALVFLLATSALGAQDADFDKAIQQAIKAGKLDEAKRLCGQWIEKAPKDERPHIARGRICVKENLIDEAIEAFETARELNPQNPDPACEMGRLFLRAGMGKEAVAEFQAALKVRKDYEPAVTGLAEATALAANPYANGVYVKLAEFSEERGLRLIEGGAEHITRAATMGGRECRGTDLTKRNWFMDFDVDDEYLFDVDLPVRITIEYFDNGTDQIALKYDSTDPGAHLGGAAKIGSGVRKTNTNTWKKHTFSLPDARFSRRGGADFCLFPNLWTKRSDLFLSSVQVVRGGLQARAEPKAVAIGGRGICTVIAKVLDADGPVADGTVVHFSTDLGTIGATAETIGGEARAEFRAANEPGEAAVTVKVGSDERVLPIPMLRGAGDVVRRRLVVHPFGQPEEWRTYGRKGTQLIVTPAPDQLREGRPTTRVQYKLNQSDPKSWVNMARPISLPGRPVKLGLWVHYDQTDHIMRVELKDATGQTHAIEMGKMSSAGWRWTVVDVGPGIYSVGGANDGRIHFPVLFSGLRFRRYYSGGPKRCEGEIYLQDLTVVTDVPKSETVELTVTINQSAAGGDTMAFCVRLGNVTAEPVTGRLRWTVTDPDGVVVDEARTEEIELGPEKRIFRDVTLKAIRSDAYRAQFVFEPTGGGGDAQDQPPSDAIRFTTVREASDFGLSAETRPVAGGVGVCVSNRRKEAAQVSLSYRVLSDRKEILRKGPLGQPNMAVDAGEVIECPVPLDGLPAGRYSILVLFDMADGERFSSLLPHEVLPSEIAVKGYTKTRDGTPISGASVRGLLIRHPGGHSELPGELVGLWTVESDDAGKFVVKAVPVPPDVNNCRLYIDAVADGFVDKPLAGLPLHGFIPSSTTGARVDTLRMTRGSALTGRVVGPDGEPVADARVHGLGAPVQRRRVRSVQPYRSRITDEDGRFTFFVTPETQMDLIVYPSQWAAKRVTLPVGKLDPGDIRLEAGTTVLGTLLDEHGKPAAGYWVAAERTDRRTSSMVSHPVRVAAKTEADGTFTLSPLKGTFTFWTPKGFQLYWGEPVQRSPMPRVAILPEQHSFDGSRERIDLELRGVPQVKVAGRLLDPDGSPVEDTIVTLHVNMLGASTMRDSVATEADGRYTFEGIPRGIETIHVSARSIRRTTQGKRTYLRAMPVAYAMGNVARLKRVDRDVLDVDFQYQLYRRPEPSSRRVTPRKTPVTHSLLDGIAKAVQDAARRLAQARPLTGRVLDEAGNGVRGAQVRVELVRRPKRGQKDGGQGIALWKVTTDVDGKYAVTTVPMPQQPEQCRIRVEIVAQGHAKMQREFPLRELLKPGTQALRVPDLRLVTEAKQ